MAKRPSQRFFVSEARVTGTLDEWNGDHGWLQPHKAVDHPQARRNRGRVYLAQAEVREDLPGLGVAVSFVLYADSSGLLATDCRLADEEEVHGRGSGYGGSRPTRAVPTSSRGWRSEWQSPHQPPSQQEDRLGGRVVSWKGDHGFIKPDVPIDHPRGGRRGDLFFTQDDVVEELAGVGAPVSFEPYINDEGRLAAGEILPAEELLPVPARRGGYRDAQPAQPAYAQPAQPASLREKDQDAILSRVHEALREAVWAAVQLAGPVESTWTPEELCKRLTRYLYKGAQSPGELLALPWRQAVERFMEHAMHSYTSACGERPWFLEMDLAQACGAACWALVSRHPEPRRQEVMQLAARCFSDRLHRTQLERAVWRVLEATFEAEPAHLNKMYGFLSRAYDAALKAASADSRPPRGLSRAEAFLKAWMSDSMTRTWNSLPEPDSFITEETVTFLFENLLFPLDEDPSFCCIPSWLLGGHQPPAGWRFVATATQAIFAEWDRPSRPSKKRRQSEEQEQEQDQEEDQAGEA